VRDKIEGPIVPKRPGLQQTGSPLTRPHFGAVFIEAAYNSAPEPKTLIIYTDTANHGTDLFYAPPSDPFLQSLLDFVNNIP
jgi:hypothetical protein